MPTGRLQSLRLFSTLLPITLKTPLCRSKREMACSIKGNVKKILLPRPGRRGDFRDIQPLLTTEDACLVSYPWIGFAVVPSQQLHLPLVATTPIGF